MYKQNTHYATFRIAGFQHHDGALVLEKLKAGKRLKLVPEPDNPYDPNAVAIYYKKKMIGYVPKDQSASVSIFLNAGHKGLFECRVLQVNKKALPWEQVVAGIYVRAAPKD